MLGETFELSKVYFEKIPIKKPDNKTEKKIETLVEKIITKKSENSQADTSKEERQIDVMVYHLYKLTFEEAKIIDHELGYEEYEKYK